MDAEAKKKALRSITYGLYVLGAADGDEVAAATVTWLSQASFNPPLIMAALKKDSHLHDLILRTRTFTANTVGEGQKEIAAAFFRGARQERGRLNGHAFERGPATGGPLLTDLPFWLEARLTDVVDRGDHTVVVAEVIEAGVRDPNAMPLSLRDTEWNYGG
ncbi:MAG: flavin reductase family protein [Sphingomonadaceae bacterium]